MPLERIRQRVVLAVLVEEAAPDDSAFERGEGGAAGHAIGYSFVVAFHYAAETKGTFAQDRTTIRGAW